MGDTQLTHPPSLLVLPPGSPSSVQLSPTRRRKPADETDNTTATLLKVATPEEAAEGAGTLASTALSLTATAMGAGMLSLPQAFADTGWLVGSISLAVVAAAADFSLVALVRAAEASGKLSVEEQAEHYFGRRGLLLAQGALVLLLFGALIILLVVATDCLQDLWQLMLCGRSDGGPCTWLASRRVLTVVCAAAVAPLCLARQLSRLRYTSLAATLSIAYVLAVVLVEWAGSLSGSRGPAGGTRPYTRPGPRSAATMLRALPIMALSYCCQFNVLPLLGELPERARAQTMRRSIHLSAALVSSSYAAFGIAGFALGGAGTPSNILRLSELEQKPRFRAALACMGLTNLLKLPLIFLPMKASAAALFAASGGGRCGGSGAAAEGERSTQRNRVAMGKAFASAAAPQLLLLAIVCLLAALLDNIAQAFDYVGATSGTLVCYVIPGALVAAAAGASRVVFAAGCALVAMGVAVSVAFFVSIGLAGE
eukprot:g4354.t1